VFIFFDVFFRIYLLKNKLSQEKGSACVYSPGLCASYWVWTTKHPLLIKELKKPLNNLAADISCPAGNEGPIHIVRNPCFVV
jgi:hypothetical protein